MTSNGFMVQDPDLGQLPRVEEQIDLLLVVLELLITEAHGKRLTDILEQASTCPLSRVGQLVFNSMELTDEHDPARLTKGIMRSLCVSHNQGFRPTCNQDAPIFKHHLQQRGIRNQTRIYKDFAINDEGTAISLGRRAGTIVSLTFRK
jgi:hypothetical protein